MTVLVWFRRDLRISDHGALAAAGDREIVPVFVLDDALLGRVRGRRRERLETSLLRLDAAVRRSGGPGLLLLAGDPRRQIPRAADRFEADTVLVSADHSPYGTRRDRDVSRELAAADRELRAVDTPWLHPPGAVRTRADRPYSVFTPYHRTWSALPTPAPIDSPARHFADPAGLKPARDLPRWPRAGRPPERMEAAGELLNLLLARGPDTYAAGRDRPDLASTSSLGAALHFGEIHPRTVLAALADDARDWSAFTRQLAWRDFYADVLSHRPEARWQNVDERFDRFRWRTGPAAEADLELWRRGRTGYPFIDAGMRQLMAEGWLHNRSRMAVASFLTKDLLIDWRWGARHFLDTLVDADVANNNLGWQWAAGTGMDAAPYFRILNPVRQGTRFDPAGDYVRTHVPELRHLPGATVHTPWEHPDGYARDYPSRMVDHGEARTEALERYRLITSGRRAV